MTRQSSANRRIVALWFPRLSTDRLQRRWKAKNGAPSPDAPPLVVAAKEKNALVIAALDRKATALGLSVGQPLANARAMLPVLKAVTANEPADLKLLGRIADWCERFTPFVSPDPPARIAARRHRRHASLRRRAGNAGPVARGSCGAGFRGAWCDGRNGSGRARTGAVSRWSRGRAGRRSRKPIQSLPIDALNLDPVTTHAFRRAGLKTIGQAASRKRSELNARFGARLVYMIDTALARAESPISPRRPLPDYRAERNFAEPVATEEVIRSTLTSLAASLGEVLEKRGEGARRLEAEFYRADGSRAPHCGRDRLSHPRSQDRRASVPREARRADRSARSRLRLRSHPPLRHPRRTRGNRRRRFRCRPERETRNPLSCRPPRRALRRRSASSPSSRTTPTSPNAPSPRCPRNMRRTQKSNGKKSAARKKLRAVRCVSF